MKIQMKRIPLEMKVVPPRATCVWDGMGLGGSISLHFPDGWEQHPSVKEVVTGKIINFKPIPCTCTHVHCTYTDISVYL